MNSSERAAREVLVWKLLNSFQASLSNITAGVVDAHIEATADCSLEAMSKSVEQYRSGRVNEHKTDFAPSAPNFARNTRAWEDALQMVRSHKGAVELRTGILNVDFGQGSIDMRGLTAEQQDEVFRTRKALPPANAPVALVANLRKMPK